MSPLHKEPKKATQASLLRSYSMTDSIPPEVLAPIADVGPMLTRRDKSLLAAGSLVCGGITWWIGRLLHVPAYPGFSGSLLGQPSLVFALVAAALGVEVGVIVGSAI